MQVAIGFDGLNGVDERQLAIEPEPLPGVAMPLDVEAVWADPIEAGKGRIELLAEIVREAGTVALDEAELGTAPFAVDIDWVVELGRPDLGQKSGLHEVGNQVFARTGDPDLFSFRECGTWLRRLAHGAGSASASFRVSVHHGGARGARRGVRETSASYARGSTALNLARDDEAVHRCNAPAANEQP